MKEKNWEMIWNFDNVLSEEEQIKRINTFNEVIVDIAADHYIQEKNKLDQNSK